MNAAHRDGLKLALHNLAGLLPSAVDEADSRQEALVLAGLSDVLDQAMHRLGLRPDAYDVLESMGLDPEPPEDKPVSLTLDPGGWEAEAHSTEPRYGMFTPEGNLAVESLLVTIRGLLPVADSAFVAQTLKHGVQEIGKAHREVWDTAVRDALYDVLQPEWEKAGHHLLWLSDALSA